jgi:hypothetical protein
MSYILTFEAFILKQNFNPLYHYTSFVHLDKILIGDLLIASTPTEPKDTMCVCFTRTKDYVFGKNDAVLIFDRNKLIVDGYKITPTDEVGVKTKKNFNKSNFDAIKSDKRKVPHKLDSLNLGTGYWVEFEERCYKDISNMHKYLEEVVILRQCSPPLKVILMDYITKYPDVKVTY